MRSVAELFGQAKLETLKLAPTELYSFSLRDNDGKEKVYTILPEKFRDSVSKQFVSFENYSLTFKEHLSGLRHLVSAFSSTPTAFSDAWNMKAEELTPDDVISLSKSGGHFQFNQIQNKDKSGSMLYQTGYAKGLVPSKGTGITKGFRHRTGGIYEEDSLNEMGIFRYATPTDAKGMMEYRFAENFSKALGVPYIYLITQWFRYKTPFEDLNDWLYMTGVAKVISKKQHPHDPIELQLISKDEALKHISSLLEICQIKGEYRVRPPMPEHMRLGWSYDKIKGEKRKSVIEYARRLKLNCPGTDCKHISFSKLKDREIHISHRISQNWNSQNSGVADVHHPYNLYLSCSGCNISLSDKYPTEIDRLINENGTIGDWLMAGLNTSEV